jgi:predicted nucleic acid-binding protein
LGHWTAIQFLDSINTALRLHKIQSTPELELDAESILRQYDDQSLSYVDAVSFAVMRDRKLRESFAFDHHFDVLGFVRHPVGPF